MDLFPSNVVSRNQQPSPGLAEKWRAWINDPVNRASLIQTGLQLLQPISPGQSVIGHIGQGVGSGLALRARYDKQQQDLQNQTLKRDMEQKEMQLRADELEQRKTAQKDDAEYRRGALEVQRGELKLNKEKIKQGGMTLSQILSQKQREYRNTESNADQKARWIQDQAADAALLGEEVTPEWYAAKSRQYDEIQEYARGNAAPPAAVNTNAPTPEDIAFTAKKYGISEDEVRKRLGL